MKTTVPVISGILPLVTMLCAIPALAQGVAGKVEVVSIAGKTDPAAQVAASAVTSQSLINATKAVGVNGDKDFPKLDWQIDGAVSAKGSKRIIFVANPIFLARSEGNEFYLMALDVASKKLVTIPIRHLVGRGGSIASSPQSSKAIAYVDKGKTDEIFVIDKSSLETVKLIPDYGAGNPSVRIIQFNSPGTFQIIMTMPSRSVNGSHKIWKWSITTAMLPTVSQLKRVILENQKQLTKYRNTIKISDVAVQRNWARCSI